MLRAGFALVLAPCASSSPPPATQPAKPAVPLDRARAYERADHVARDYRAAAEIYRAACNDGQGDTEACDAWLRASLHNEACAELGCLGDERAAKLAESHGAPAIDCDRARSKASAPSPEVALAQFAALRDRMCACTDKTCAEKVNDELAAWTMRTDESAFDQSPAMHDVGKQLVACQAKLTTGP